MHKMTRIRSLQNGALALLDRIDTAIMRAHSLHTHATPHCEHSTQAKEPTTTTGKRR